MGFFQRREVNTGEIGDLEMAVEFAGAALLAYKTWTRAKPRLIKSFEEAKKDLKKQPTEAMAVLQGAILSSQEALIGSVVDELEERKAIRDKVERKVLSIGEKHRRAEELMRELGY